MEIKFNCTGCGLCCTNVGNAVYNAQAILEHEPDNEVAKEVAAFPHKTDETGRCSKLTEDNKCSIYESRPLICHVNRIYETFYSKTMSRSTYYKSQENACKILQKNAEKNKNSQLRHAN